MRDPAAFLVRRAAARLRSGSLVVTDAQGRWTAGEGKPSVAVEVHDARAYAALARRWSQGLAEGYINGWWDSDDLTGLIQLLLENMAAPLARLDQMGGVLSALLSLWERGRAPSAEADRSNVRAHYDLPPELFTSMLDESLTYSCAVFAAPSDDLATAQRTKLDRVCQKLDLGPSDHVVEIGSGWGGFAIHAASRYGCRVTTTTVSAAQFEEATRRVAAAGLTDRVTVLDRDYRELTGTYDKLVSIEMIEAVDWRRHDEFFATCDRLLAPDGMMLLQAIVIADRSYERAKHHDDFVRRRIFPGGCIPSITAILDALTRATQLRLFDLEDIGRHYARTLHLWGENVQAHRDHLSDIGLDDTFLRLWWFYLCYCEAAFLERHISDVQMVLTKPRNHPQLTARRL